MTDKNIDKLLEEIIVGGKNIDYNSSSDNKKYKWWRMHNGKFDN